MDQFTKAYIVCALWSSTDDSDQPLDDNYDADDIAPETLAQMAQDCRDFQEGNAPDLADLDAAQCGHDFWLTRNGHGAGFWDRGYGNRGDRLTDACKPYGNVDLYIGDDGKIYQL